MPNFMIEGEEFEVKIDEHITNILGQGYNSITGEVKIASAILHSEPRLIMRGVQDSRFEYMDSLEDRLKRSYVKLHAAFSGFGGGASVDYSRLAEEQVVSYFQNFQAYDHTPVYEAYIQPQDDNAIEPTALNLLDKNPTSFLERYGDCFISKVYIGGYLVFDFVRRKDTSSLVDEVLGKASFKVGKIEGSAEMEQKVKIMAENNYYNVRVKSIPPIRVDAKIEENSREYLNYITKNYYDQIIIDKKYGNLGIEYEYYSDWIDGRIDLSSKIDTKSVSDFLDEVARRKIKWHKEYNLLQFYLENDSIVAKNFSLASAKELSNKIQTRISLADSTAVNLMKNPLSKYDKEALTKDLSDENIDTPRFFEDFSLPVLIRSKHAKTSSWRQGGVKDRKLMARSAEPAEIERGIEHILTFNFENRFPLKGLNLEKNLRFWDGTTTGFISSNITVYPPDLGPFPLENGCIGFKVRIVGPLAPFFKVYALYESIERYIFEKDDVGEKDVLGYWGGGPNMFGMLERVMLKISTRA